MMLVIVFMIMLRMAILIIKIMTRFLTIRMLMSAMKMIDEDAEACDQCCDDLAPTDHADSY